MGINYYNGRVCLNVLAGSLENAKEIYTAAEKLSLIHILTVHVGNYPPALTDVLKLLGKNDIVTHAYLSLIHIYSPFSSDMPEKNTCSLKTAV